MTYLQIPRIEVLLLQELDRNYEGDLLLSQVLRMEKLDIRLEFQVIYLRGLDMIYGLDS